jgi:transcriptional regulator with XRE-family HTH domain
VAELTASQEIAMTVPASDAPEIILNTRKIMRLSQTAFGAKYGFKQSAVSKFEKGRVSPPGWLVLRCIDVLKGAQGSGGEFSSREVAQLVESRLQGPQFSKLRAVLVDLIESISASPEGVKAVGAQTD